MHLPQKFGPHRDGTALDYMEEPPAAKAEVPAEDGQQRLAHEEPVEALRLSKARVAKARVDSSIGDEAAGRARAELAAASEARRADEHRELAQRSTDLRRRTRRPAQRTDDDIADEVAGAARISFAAASRARREKEQRALAIKNAEYHRRIRETNARTSSLRGTGSSGPTPGTSSSFNNIDGSTVIATPTVMAVILRGQQQALAEARAVAAATSAELAKRRVAAESGLTADQRRMRRAFVGSSHGSSSSNANAPSNARNEGEDVLGVTRTGRDEDGAATAGDSVEATAAASAADAIAAKRVEQTASTEAGTAAGTAASGLQPKYHGRPSTAATSKLESSPPAAFLKGQGGGTAPRTTPPRRVSLPVSLPASATRKPGTDARHDAREPSIKDDDEYEPTHMAYLRITTLDRNRPTGDPRAHPAWDRAPFRPVPYELRGIRPLRYMNEPWTEAARHAWDEQPTQQPTQQPTVTPASSGVPVPSDDANASKAVVIAAVVRHAKPTRTLTACVTPSRVRGAASPYTMPFATAGLTRLDDGGPSYPSLHDDMATLHRRRQLENEASVTTGLHAQPWDSTPWHSVPTTLRGLKPVTREPWATSDGELCDMEAITIFHDYDKFRAGDAKEEMPQLLALKHASSSANAVTAAARSRRRTSDPQRGLLGATRDALPLEDSSSALVIRGKQPPLPTVPDAAWRPAEASVQIFGLSREAKDEAVRKAASDVAADEASAATEIKAAAEAKAAAHGKAAAEAKAAAQGKAATEAKAAAAQGKAAAAEAKAAAQGKAAAEAKAAAQGKAAAEAKAAADARGAAAQQAEAEAVVTTGTAAGRSWAARVEAAAEEGVDELVVVDEGNLLERERSKIQSKILAMQQEDVGADGPATAWATGSSEAKPAVRRAYEHLIPALDLSDSALYADE